MAEFKELNGRETQYSSLILQTCFNNIGASTVNLDADKLRTDLKGDRRWQARYVIKER